jgi:DNA (cytosine-5)-methyltransferase 1
MKALDLFCGAGGASMGLYQAGYKVTGVDVIDQPNYPFKLIKGDALKAHLKGFDLIWASPPCQAFTAYRRRRNHVQSCRNLIPAVRRLLTAAGTPWVIENVPGAPLNSPITLCGSMFELDVRRHRLFETSFLLPQLKCQHHKQLPRFPPATNRKNLRKTVEIGVWRIPLDVQQKAMGVDWMTREELSQAIPPVYAQWIATYFLRSRNSDQGGHI